MPRKITLLVVGMRLNTGAEPVAGSDTGVRRRLLEQPEPGHAQLGAGVVVVGGTVVVVVGVTWSSRRCAVVAVVAVASAGRRTARTDAAASGARRAPPVSSNGPAPNSSTRHNGDADREPNRRHWRPRRRRASGRARRGRRHRKAPASRYRRQYLATVQAALPDGPGRDPLGRVAALLGLRGLDRHGPAERRLGKLVFDMTGSELALGLLGLAEFAPAPSWCSSPARSPTGSTGAAWRRWRSRSSRSSWWPHPLRQHRPDLDAADLPPRGRLTAPPAPSPPPPPARSPPTPSTGAPPLAHRPPGGDVAGRARARPGPRRLPLRGRAVGAVRGRRGARRDQRGHHADRRASPRRTCCRARRRRRRREAPSLHEAVEGLRFVRSQPILLGAISLDLFAVLFGARWRCSPPSPRTASVSARSGSGGCAPPPARCRRGRALPHRASR